MSAHSFFIANSWKYIPLSALFYHGTVYFVRILLILLYTLKSQCFPGGPLLGHPWTISGPLLGHPWTTPGPPINFHSFHTLKFQHFPGGPPLGHCWATPGPPIRRQNAYTHWNFNIYRGGPLLGHSWWTCIVRRDITVTRWHCQRITNVISGSLMLFLNIWAKLTFFWLKSTLDQRSGVLLCQGISFHKTILEKSKV